MPMHGFTSILSFSAHNMNMCKQMLTFYLLAYFVLSYKCVCCNENQNVRTLHESTTMHNNDGSSENKEHEKSESKIIGNTDELASERTTVDSDKVVDGDISPLELYRHLFQEKRKSHGQAVRAILKMEKYEKQYSMLKVILDKMFSTTREAKVVLMESGYTPGDPFPTDEKLREVLSMIVENTVFFGDLLLHLPDISHDLLKRNNEWQLIARWSISFANDTNIYEEKEIKLLSLMAQELGIVDKDPDYLNPYKTPERDLHKEIENLMKESMAEVKKKQKKQKEKKKRGPRLSNVRHTEL